MELSKRDTQAAKGIAIIGMVVLHLFCRITDLPYSPVLWIRDIPLVYYLGLFGDICVPIYCFCSGYAHYLLYIRNGASYSKRIPGKILRFLCNYWIVLVVFRYWESFLMIPAEFPALSKRLWEIFCCME